MARAGAWGLVLLLLLTACASGRRTRRAARLPARPPARVADDYIDMDDVVPPSLRGLDEVELPPERPTHAAPRQFSWLDADGRRILMGWPKTSSSHGRPSRGTLERGRELDEHGHGYFHRGDRSWGTDELVAVIHWGFRRLLRQYPDAPDLLIRDLSELGGGHAAPHRSHQSGRDVDVAYYLVDDTAVHGFVTAAPSTLDAEKTWALLEAMLATGMVQFIFVNHALQGPLYDQALRSGWTEEGLSDVFEYPRSPGSRQGVIRHTRGHDDHFHLRIYCPPEDEACRD